MRLNQLFVSVILASMPTLGFAWGPQGHSIIAETAADLAENGSEFWKANVDTLGNLANVPDAVWKSLQTAALEKPTHFFQIDAYVADPAQFPTALFSFLKAVAQEGQDFVTENGTAPWRADQMYVLAVEALRKKDDANALQIVGALAHYIGDLSQPLHVTKNFDGPAGERNGIHKFFETDNLKSEKGGDLFNEVQAKTQILLAQKTISYSFDKGILEGTFASVGRTAQFVDEVLKIDSQKGRSGDGADEQLVIAKARLADGSATLAVVLSKMWLESGRKDESRFVKVNNQPKWIPLDYTSSNITGGGAPGTKPFSSTNSSAAESACVEL